MKLRDYQQEAIAAIQLGFRKHTRLLAVLPTGAGKTILFAHLAATVQPGRTLVLAHREELLSQAIDKIRKATGLVAEMEKASNMASMTAPVVVASVQTMINRCTRWPADHFDLIVVDEAHHVLADSYQKVLRHFTPETKVLGVTATPDRGDKKNLGAYFQEIAYEVGLPRLIRENYLSKIVVKRIPLSIDLRAVGRQGGDFKLGELGTAITPMLAKVANVIANEVADRKIIVFLPLVEMARQFAEELTRNGIEARAVAGEDSGNDRAGSLDWFARTGKGSALCNAMLLTEGFDQPDVDCVVVLRPTEIRSLYAQMIGRGTRIHPGKENLLVLDFLWLTEQHQLVNMSRLVASNPEDALAVDALIAVGEEVDPLEAQRDAEEDRLRKLIKILNTVKTRPAGTYDAIELAVAMHDEELMEFVPSLEWHEKPVSPAQADALLKAGFDPASVTCRGHASKILDRIALRRLNNLATPKQVRQLKRLGHANPHTETFKGASDFITKRFNR